MSRLSDWKAPAPGGIEKRRKNGREKKPKRENISEIIVLKRRDKERCCNNLIK